MIGERDLATVYDSQGLQAPPCAAMPAPRRKAVPLPYMDSLRAIAILGVVLGHCPTLAFGAPENMGRLASFAVALVDGWTALFVFVSGFLFHHVSLSHFTYPEFITGKVRRLLIPYAVCTFVLLLVEQGQRLVEIGIQQQGLAWTANAFAALFATTLLSGQVGASMWYIPFVMMIFILAPAFVRFAKAPRTLQIILLIAAFLVGMTVNRSSGNADKIQNVVYFLFFFLAGVGCSENRTLFERVLRHRWVAASLWLATIALAAVITRENLLWAFYDSWFAWHGVNYDYLIKITLLLALCSTLLCWPALNAGRLKSLARDSFGLFFVHNLPLSIMFIFAQPRTPLIETGIPILNLALIYALVLGSSVLVIKLVQRLAGRKSALLIGA